MGNRVLVQLTDGVHWSPVLYGHWSGHQAKPWLEELTERMGNRLEDLSYSFARLVQIALGDDSEVTGFGVFNAKGILTSEDSHGDAGVYVLNVSTKEVAHFE